jgi:hypothetical protein
MVVQNHEIKFQLSGIWVPNLQIPDNVIDLNPIIYYILSSLKKNMKWERGGKNKSLRI